MVYMEVNTRYLLTFPQKTWNPKQRRAEQIKACEILNPKHVREHQLVSLADQNES